MTQIKTTVAKAKKSCDRENIKMESIHRSRDRNESRSRSRTRTIRSYPTTCSDGTPLRRSARTAVRQSTVELSFDVNNNKDNKDVQTSFSSDIHSHTGSSAPSMGDVSLRFQNWCQAHPLVDWMMPIIIMLLLGVFIYYASSFVVDRGYAASLVGGVKGMASKMAKGAAAMMGKTK